MPTRIILIRAVNVGPAQLPMAEWRTILEELGATDVRTYIASGNAIANVPGDPDEFDRAVEQAVEQKYGYFREVMSRTPKELQQAIDAHPFKVIEPKFSYIAPLSAAPPRKALELADDVKTGKDEWLVIGRDLHIRYDGGAGRADLDMNKLLKKLGVKGTARNLNTVKKMLEIAESG
jgi:uncharacterized protein (DUF1697 family)